ncbi:hypothetical protein SELMODRAFT_419706 [Selaginella moellendorffii]|uniref:Uncharacterized protein n=1 Tax=Selaginella moellendorffii TaxID=88036 RepID=D8S9T0_SELML|nr:hypothetical protein SELMODRAFT_419706 [Selaginella moellendorffii]
MVPEVKLSNGSKDGKSMLRRILIKRYTHFAQTMEEGIQRQTYAKEQNGVVYRRMATVGEAAQCIHKAADLPLTFWAKAHTHMLIRSKKLVQKPFNYFGFSIPLPSEESQGIKNPPAVQPQLQVPEAPAPEQQELPVIKNIVSENFEENWETSFNQQMSSVMISLRMKGVLKSLNLKLRDLQNDNGNQLRGI